MYVLAHFPHIDTRSINLLRSQYDPVHALIEPHITVMFPAPDDIGEERLARHIENILSGWQPFPIHLRGFHRSWDDYLFLLVEEGREKIIRLHDEIYTGMLAEHLRQDIPFTPHVTLGAFGKEPQKYAQALAEAERLGIDARSVLDRLHLVHVSDDRSNIIARREFRLAAPSQAGAALAGCR